MIRNIYYFHQSHQGFPVIRYSPYLYKKTQLDKNNTIKKLFAFLNLFSFNSTWTCLAYYFMCGVNLLKQIRKRTKSLLFPL